MAQQMPLPQDALGDIIEQSIPSDWLEGEVERNLGNIFAYLKGKEADLSLAVNLAPVKGNLSQNFVQAFEAKIQELPECTREQMLEMQGGNVENLECIPPQLKQGGLLPEFSRQISGMTEKLPDRIDLAEQLPPEAEEKFVEIQRGYRGFRMGMWGITALTALLFIILLLLNKANLVGYLKNLSIVLLIGSVVSFAVQAWVSSNVLQILPPLPKMGPAALNSVRDDLISVTVSSFLNYTSNITLAVFAISIIFLIFVFLKNVVTSEQ